MIMPDVRRFCEFPGCHELAEKGGHYCKKHAILKEKQRRLAQLQSHDKSPAVRGYNAKWNKARKIFLASHPLCAVCGAPATDVDHIIPHKGNKNLFWDQSNWQALCHSCHSRKTAREDMGKW